MQKPEEAEGISPGDLLDTECQTPQRGQALGSRCPPFREAKREFERGYVIKVLEMACGKVATAARLAGKDRKDFYDLMKKHQIDPATYRN